MEANYRFWLGLGVPKTGYLPHTSKVCVGPGVDPRADGKYYVSDYSAPEIQTAVTALNALDADVTLVVDEADTIASSSNADEEITWEFLPGNVVTINASQTLTINGPVVAPIVQIFANSGTVTFGDGEKLKVAYPQWWGAKGDWDWYDGTNNLVPIDDCLDSGARYIFLPEGLYYIGDTSTGLTMGSDVAVIEGAGKEETVINYEGNGTALTVTGGSVTMKHLTILCRDIAADAIEFNTAARNVTLRDVYVQNWSTLTTQTGSGILLDASSGGTISGINLHNFQSLGFKYGIKCVGSDTVNTVTSITGTDVWLVGQSASKTAGSCGIYTDANTSGRGSMIVGGTIEEFVTGISIADSAAPSQGLGVSYTGDFEGNTTDWSTGDGFSGEIFNTNGGSFFKAGNNAASNFWWKESYTAGGSRETYSYYNHYFDTRGNGSLLKFGARDAQSSNADMGGFAFAGVGDFGPHKNYVYQQNHKLTWHTEWPNVGTWSTGDVCINSSPSTGNPKGWVCTVAGSPGTWVSTGNL